MPPLGVSIVLRSAMFGAVLPHEMDCAAKGLVEGMGWEAGVISPKQRCQTPMWVLYSLNL
jgi:hypothetical protein